MSPDIEVYLRIYIQYIALYRTEMVMYINILGDSVVFKQPDILLLNIDAGCETLPFSMFQLTDHSYQLSLCDCQHNV